MILRDLLFTSHYVMQHLAEYIFLTYMYLWYMIREPKGVDLANKALESHGTNKGEAAKALLCGRK